MKKIKFNIAEWEEKLKNGADINKPDAKGWTALDYAIRADSMEGVEFCIKNGADVNRKIEMYDYATPLHFAAKYSKKPEMIEILVKHGADVNAWDEWTGTPIHYAALFNSNPDIIRKMVELGADINICDRNTIFDFACTNNSNLEIIKTIIRLGANFDIQDALCSVALNPNLNILKFILKLGGDINAKYNDSMQDFPLHNAAMNDNSEILKFLLKKGAYKSVNARNEFGDTPLFVAIRWDKLENIKLLIQHGADIFAKNNRSETCFEKARDFGNYEVLKLLLMHIKNVKTRRKYGYNLVANSAKITADLIMVLRECNVDVCKSEDLSDWIFCLCVDNHKMAKNVIKTGIKLNISFSDLSFRILDNPKGISAKILSLLTDINVRDENQNTVLFDFIKHNNSRIVNMLIDAGADVNAKNNQGETPLSYAVKYKAKDKIFKKLLANGANVETEDYMVKSAVVAFWDRQKIKPTTTQLRMFKENNRIDKRKIIK